MKKILILIFIIILLGACLFSKINIKKKVNIKKDRVIQKSVQKNTPLYENKIEKIDQEYTLYQNNIKHVSVSNNYTDENDDVKVDNNKNDDVKVDNNKNDTITNEEVQDDETNNENEENSDDEKEEDLEDNENIEVDEVLLKVAPSNYKNGFYNENNSTYYYEDNIKVTGIKNIDGKNHYFSPSGRYLGTNKIKVIDVSYYQKDIDWDLFYRDSDCYGVILRLGYWTTLDKKFERNIKELKRLNIPYGIYLFSYATTSSGALKEANFTNSMIDKYDIKPILGIYYDLESWKTNSSNSDSITKNQYNYIAKKYVETVKNYTNNLYSVGVYSGRWYAMNRLGKIAKSYVSWVAEYNNTLKYDDTYFMWQYTSKGSVPGVNGNVDISYIIN